MKVNFPGFPALVAGTGEPLEMLSACHGRVKNQCATLRCLVAHLLLAHGVDAEALRRRPT